MYYAFNLFWLESFYGYHFKSTLRERSEEFAVSFVWKKENQVISTLNVTILMDLIKYCTFL